MDIATLISRVERLTGPDHDVDVILAGLAFPDKWEDVTDEYGGSYKLNVAYQRQQHMALHSPTSSVDAAIALAGAVLPGETWRVEMIEGRFWAYFWDDPDCDAISIGSHQTSPAIALCIAIMRAYAESPRKLAEEKER